MVSHYFYFDTKNKRILTFNREVSFDNLVRMNAEQEAYYTTHKKASYEEIWYAGHIPVPERTLEQAKQEKMFEIEMYDVSENVNGFFYNGNLMWLDKATRVGLVNSCNSLEAMGIENISIWFNGYSFTLPITECKMLLASLEIYAIECYNVTEQHKIQVNTLETIEEVDNFDVTADYPERPNFNTQE